MNPDNPHILRKDFNDLRQSIQIDIKNLRESVQIDIQDIKRDLNELREMIMYAPGGPMYDLAHHDYVKNTKNQH